MLDLRGVLREADVVGPGEVAAESQDQQRADSDGPGQREGPCRGDGRKKMVHPFSRFQARSAGFFCAVVDGDRVGIARGHDLRLEGARRLHRRQAEREQGGDGLTVLQRVVTGGAAG